MISHERWSGIILCMHPANERWRYTVTPSLIVIGWAHTQNDPRVTLYQWQLTECLPVLCFEMNLLSLVQHKIHVLVKTLSTQWIRHHIDGLVQERCNSSVKAMELHVFHTNPSIFHYYNPTSFTLNQGRNRHFEDHILTHWGLETSYGDRDLGQHWLR